MMRFCPNCHTERSLTELVCEGDADGVPCEWDLSLLAVRPPGWRPQTAATLAPAPRTCPSGHPTVAGDLICGICGGDLPSEAAEVAAASPSEQPPPGQSLTTSGESLEPDPSASGEEDATVIAGWRVVRRLPAQSTVRERFIVVSEATGSQALLTLYAQGREPDPGIYDVLRSLDRDHVPEILETGRWNDRPFEVSEDISGGALSDVALLPGDEATLATVVAEIGGALNAFAEFGLRHRDLRPGAILVRSRDPLDLVITSFGSARLSEFDLDVVSPLEITRYAAPEAVAGGVAAASDWWSLGMLLLEQVTQGTCFAGANDQAFLIHVVTNGAPIPEGLEPRTALLLRGLLARDRHQRWGWTQVQAWLQGDAPPTPASEAAPEPDGGKAAIRLGGRRYASAASFALAAADAARWDEARELLLSGALVTWMDDAGLDAKVQAQVRQLSHNQDLSEDVRLGLALMALNPAMPLTARGEIVTPGWLLDHPDEGYALVVGPAPDLLKADDAEPWLSHLKVRAEQVRTRARQLDITLDEDALRAHLLSTSRSRLAALWADRRRVLPDTDHGGLIALIERRQATDEDYILLLSAAVGQFRSADAIIEEAAEAARRAEVESFDIDVARAALERPRRELYAEADARLTDFARCGLTRVDEWADQFRLERRLPVSRLLALLAVPAEAWREPPRQTYVATLLDFFAKRITASALRGPLTRLTIGKWTPRVDLAELGAGRPTAAAVLDHLLLRNDQPIDLDPAVFLGSETLERRLRSLFNLADIYRRDTGIDGLYLGFPFLLMREAKSGVRPRIAPVLLWPVKLQPAVGARGRVALSFDHSREQVRLNPAFEPLLGPEAKRKWEERAQELLGRATLTAAEVMDGLAPLVTQVEGRALAGLPNRDVAVTAGEDRLACAGALFHLNYVGQAVMEDLRQLKSIPPSGTSLETALRVTEPPERTDTPRTPEQERFFTAASDPSQEAAVLDARQQPGLLVEGPPGTGKSQTIVNMVADAIGRRKTLLVVCQKQSALEVVKKRLEAEGLTDRFIMVSDVNRDRTPVIRAVREQLEAIRNRTLGGDAQWRSRRIQVAARIEALEAELDRYQAALHATNAGWGLSYRTVLADLIGYSGGSRPAIDAPALRRVLAESDVGTVAVLQETCGPLARLWLPARFEDSPLQVLKPFSPDAGTAAAFTGDFAAYHNAEIHRAKVLAQTPAATRIDDPGVYREWSAEHAAALLALSDPERERLARWGRDFAPAATAGPAALAELAAVAEGLATLAPSTGHKAELLAEDMPEADLASWRDLADGLLARPSLWQRLSPARWSRARRTRRYLTDQGLEFASLSAFASALHAETALRPWRARLAALGAQLSDTEPTAHRTVVDLLGISRRLADALDAVRGLAARIAAHPQPAAAWAAAATGGRDAWETLLDAAEQGLARYEARGLSEAALEALQPWFRDDWRAARAKAVGEDAEGAAVLADIAAAANSVAAYQRFRPRADALDTLALKVFRSLRAVGPDLAKLADTELDAEVRRIIGREARLAWKTMFEAEQPVLMLEAGELEAKAEALAQADREMRELNGRLLIDGVDASALRPAREWTAVDRLQGQQALRLREFVDRAAELGLMTLRPVWLMNPDVASRLLPLRPGLFDTVIFDEASQMPVEYAVPTLYRSRTMVVSGDDKQMPPSGFFVGKVDSQETDDFESDEPDEAATDAERQEAEETWNRREIKDCTDLLQLARTVLPGATLQIHYRSLYRELIQFSNAAFYQGRLSVPARRPDDEVRRVRPIEIVRADGVYEAQVNPQEARAVVEAVAGLWAKPGPRRSMGVVTFNRKQADLIETVLEERAEKDPVFRGQLAEERDRVDDGEDMGFFVKNVENVQGDERDVIVFSSTFGKNAQGVFRRSFGVLGQAGGERRLNVAVTRARSKVILVTSMPIALISDLLTTRRACVSPRDFLQAYFEYARAISSGELETAQGLLARMAPDRRPGGRAPTDGLDGFEASVADYLRELGWSPVSGREEGAFGLDFAIEDPRTGLYGIGIECDAPRHPLLSTARAREMWRPDILRRSIPRIHRVTAQAWLEDPQGERFRLRDAVALALTEGELV